MRNILMLGSIAVMVLAGCAPAITFAYKVEGTTITSQAPTRVEPRQLPSVTNHYTGDPTPTKWRAPMRVSK